MHTADVFDESGENKLEYTTLFDKYTEITGNAGAMVSQARACGAHLTPPACAHDSEALLMKRLAERVEVRWA